MSWKNLDLISPSLARDGQRGCEQQVDLRLTQQRDRVGRVEHVRLLELDQAVHVDVGAPDPVQVRHVEAQLGVVAAAARVPKDPEFTGAEGGICDLFEPITCIKMPKMLAKKRMPSAPAAVAVKARYGRA